MPTSIMSVTSADTDAGFAMCPPPSDFILHQPAGLDGGPAAGSAAPPRAMPMRTVPSNRLSIQVATSSGEYSGFEGAESEAGFAVRETAIPATDTNLRRTVEDLVESRLRQSTISESSDTESVASGVSAEALSRIVAQTVDRMLQDRGPDATPRNSAYSTGSRDTLLGFSPRSSAAFDSDDGRPDSFVDDLPPTEPRRQRRGSEGRDARYVAGNATLDQLLPTPLASARTRARDRIRRLVSGKGDEITGQRIVVKRDRLLGFGFTISGEAPVFVHSVTPGGPCDRGVDGLMAGDVVLKVGDVPCARSSRDFVLDLVDSDDVGEFLYLVVARTPPPTRKSYPSATRAAGVARRTGGGGGGGGMSAREAERHSSPPTSAAARPSASRWSPHKTDPFSGWLSILVTRNRRMQWDRYWAVLSEGTLVYYDGPDAMGSSAEPEDTISLEDTTCTLCGVADRIKREFAFKIIHDTQQPVYLSGPNKANVQEWIKRINSAADEASVYGFDV